MRFLFRHVVVPVLTFAGLLFLLLLAAWVLVLVSPRSLP